MVRQTAKKPDRGCQIIKKMSRPSTFRRIVSYFQIAGLLLLVSCSHKRGPLAPLQVVATSQSELSYSGVITQETVDQLDFLPEAFVGDLLLASKSLAVVLKGVSSYEVSSSYPHTMIRHVFVHRNQNWQSLGWMATNS